jgi:predicted DsbA family dithiol-disulfide isomerase
VTWLAFELHPGIPPEGTPIPYSPERRTQGRLNFQRLADPLGLEYGERTHWFDSGPAHEAYKWAIEQGAEDPFRRAVFRAYFVENRNIGSAEVLAHLANGVGLAGDELRGALTEARYRDAVTEEFEQSRAMGINAVPTFISGRYALVGAHPLENLRSLIVAGQQTLPAQS